MNRGFPTESKAVKSFGKEEYEVRNVNINLSGAKISHQWALGNEKHFVPGSSGHRPLTVR